MWADKLRKHILSLAEAVLIVTVKPFCSLLIIQQMIKKKKECACEGLLKCNFLSWTLQIATNVQDLSHLISACHWMCTPKWAPMSTHIHTQQHTTFLQVCTLADFLSPLQS